jgi:hypothetical protein
LPGPANEGFSAAILFGTRRLADHHPASRFVASAENRLLASLAKTARSAVRHRGPQGWPIRDSRIDTGNLPERRREMSRWLGLALVRRIA